MNANGFSSNSGVQSAPSVDRFKPLFQSSVSSSDVKKGALGSEQNPSLSIKAGESSGRQVFSKSIEFSLGLKYESSYEFKIPSPQEVAKTVLGFVENRINAEKQAGASVEKLNDLMAQARTGIEKGYAQAEKDIEGLGLMTDELAEDISKGFNLIDEGLDTIEASLEQGEQTSVAASVIKGQESDGANNSTELAKPNAENFFGQTGVVASDKTVLESTSSKFVSLERFTENKADFVLNTQEGDQVLIRLADLQALNYEKNEQGESFDLAKSSQFEFSVKGDLSENELKAINNILEQVENISSLFFNDQFEDAFNSAMNLGFDSEQIASFSLDLSKLQVQEVRTYQEGSRTALDSYKRNQPLINVAQQFERFEALLEPLARFEKVNSIIESLVSKALETYAFEKRDSSAEADESINNYQLFAGKLLDAVLLSDKNGDI